MVRRGRRGVRGEVRINRAFFTKISFRGQRGGGWRTEPRNRRRFNRQEMAANGGGKEGELEEEGEAFLRAPHPLRRTPCRGAEICKRLAVRWLDITQAHVREGVRRTRPRPTEDTINLDTGRIKSRIYSPDTERETVLSCPVLSRSVPSHPVLVLCPVCRCRTRCGLAHQWWPRPAVSFPSTHTVDFVNRPISWIRRIMTREDDADFFPRENRYIRLLKGCAKLR